MDRAAAWAFAKEWIDAWNAQDLVRILSHYTDDFEMRSPLIVERMKIPEGVLRGKKAVADYWEIGLAAHPPLRFELLEVFQAPGMLALLYLSVTRQRRVLEVMEFNGTGQVTRSAGVYAV
jgi:ketosteroid isomerase-like protein